MTKYPAVPTAAEEAWHEKYVTENDLDENDWDGFEEWMDQNREDAQLQAAEWAADVKFND